MRGRVARQKAQAEELTLLVADNGTGYFGVSLPYPNRPMLRANKRFHLLG